MSFYSAPGQRRSSHECFIFLPRLRGVWQVSVHQQTLNPRGTHNRFGFQSQMLGLGQPVNATSELMRCGFGTTRANVTHPLLLILPVDERSCTTTLHAVMFIVKGWFQSNVTGSMWPDSAIQAVCWPSLKAQREKVRTGVQLFNIQHNFQAAHFMAHENLYMAFKCNSCLRAQSSRHIQAMMSKVIASCAFWD